LECMNAKNADLEVQVSLKKMKNKALTGNEAAAEAMRQINPDVVAAYPITPSTQIMQKFADFHADGLVNTELIRVESEHSALSACVGASAAGARTITATSSAGLALMWEILGVASGLRLPIVMDVVNRALSSPLNIHCDHSDSMGCRDHGWIQIYSENAQEVYYNTILGVRLAEKVSIPVMIMQDGFVISHGVEGVKVLDDAKVKKFLGKYNPKYNLLRDNVTIGSLALPDSYFEIKKQQIDAMNNVKKEYLAVCKEMEKLTGEKFDLFEYKKDKTMFIVLNSTAGILKEIGAGFLKLKLFRPFPYKEVREVLKDCENVIVLDKSVSYGADAPLFSEIKNTLHGTNVKLHSCIFGLGGRDIYEEDIENILKRLKDNKLGELEYIGLK